MSSILRAAASGLLAQQYNLDLISNNIANVDTTGFKKSRANFADAIYDVTTTTPDGSATPMEFRTGTGVTLAASQRMFSPGALKETDNPWDLAIAGDGFFQIALPDGRRAYTRDGSFQTDAQGRLTTAQGFLVDPPLTVPPGAENVAIEQNGVVQAQVDGKQVQLGTIPIVTFANPEGLVALGQNLFAPSDASGNAEAGPAGTGSRGQIMSGVLEGSNVDLAEEMTRAIEAQRAYQLSIKVLQTADEMLGLANNIRR